MSYQAPQPTASRLATLGAIATGLGIGLLIVLFLTASRGADAAQESYAEQTTTTLLGSEPAIDPAMKGLGPLDQPEVIDMAEQLGITREEAVANFEEQDRHLDFVEGVEDHPEFVDYRGPTSANGELWGGDDAVMLVEPGAEDEAVFQGGPPDVEIRPAPLPADDREQALNETKALASRRLGAAYKGVSYDVFDNSYTIWVEQGTLDELESLQIDWDVRANPRSDVRLEAFVGIEPMWGGESAVRFWHRCTTAFGIKNRDHWGGYLSAGHCGERKWEVRGYTSWGTAGHAVGGYKDRVAIQAGGSSYWTWITDSKRVDMAWRPLLVTSTLTGGIITSVGEAIETEVGLSMLSMSCLTTECVSH